MKLEDIRIYNSDMELVAILPNFIASNWEIKFSEYGNGEIELAQSSSLVSLLTENQYLFLVQGDIQSVITGYVIGKTCTIFTRTLEWLLTKFVVTEVTVGENLFSTVKNILSVLPEAFNLKINDFDDETDMSGYIFDKATDVYSAVKDCIKDEKTGFSLQADFKEKSFTFSLTEAKENADILLCDEYKTSYDSSYTYDIQAQAQGAYFYHQLTCMGRYDAQNNSPELIQSAENYGKYYIASSDGSRFGLSIKKGDIIACRSKSGIFEIIDEAKPFLVEKPPEEEGIFVWSAVLDATNEENANKELAQKKPMDMLTLQTRLTYGKDYKIGDVINTRFYCDGLSISRKKLVSSVHLWVERESTGASPTMTEI